MHDIVCRLYEFGDFSACLALFDGNVPTFFAPEERSDFCEFLESIDADQCHYLVLTRQGSVVACGGLSIGTEKRQARLAWGMVDRTLHGQGLGTILTRARLEMATAVPDIAEVGLETSQHTCSFYEGFGFTVSKIIPDGFGPGLDRWDMTLRLR